MRLFPTMPGVDPAISIPIIVENHPLVQVRFPRSKRKRIRKKWGKRRCNYRRSASLLARGQVVVRKSPDTPSLHGLVRSFTVRDHWTREMLMFALKTKTEVSELTFIVITEQPFWARLGINV